MRSASSLRPGEDDDGQVEGLAQAPRDGEPVLVGKLQVEDHEVDDLRAEHLVHVRAGFRERDLEIVLREVLADQVADGGVVVDDQDMGFHRVGRSSCLGHFNAGDRRIRKDVREPHVRRGGP